MLLADRFLSMSSGIIDLATGARVHVRRLPHVSREEETAWDECCALRLRSAAPTTSRLVDHGLLADGTRFEAYRTSVRGEANRAPRQSTEALCKQLSDVLAAASFGEPRVVRLTALPAQQPRHVVEALARVARIGGFVPLLADLALPPEQRSGRVVPPPSLEQLTVVQDILKTRHVMLVAGNRVDCRHDSGCSAARQGAVCPASLARLIARVGALNSRPTLLLLGPRPAAARCAEPGARRHAINLGQQGPGRAARDEGVSAVARAAEAHETYRVSASDLVRVRTRAADALEQVRGPRCQRAEYALRGFAGALARRGDAAGSAWVTLRLGCLLLERGRPLEAARAFEAGREQFDRSRSARGAVRATIYLGLAWTDDRRLAEASAALRCSAVAAGELGASDLETEARIGLVRCLYWQGRFDEAATLLATLRDSADDASTPSQSASGPFDDDMIARAGVVREAQMAEAWAERLPRVSLEGCALIAADPVFRVRLAALGARVALANGDLREAMQHATTALDAARATRHALDLTVAHTACATAHAALRDIDALRKHVNEGIGYARQAHAPLRAMRLRLLASDALRQSGREADARSRLHRLATLRLDRLPGLLRARLALVVNSPGCDAERGVLPGDDEAARFAIAAFPWRCRPHARDVTEDLVGVLETCHHSDDEEGALARICQALRDRSHAVSAAIIGRGDGAAAMLARAGCAPGEAPLVERVLDTGVAVPPHVTSFGTEAASPVRYAGVVIGAVFVRWPADSIVDARRVTALLSAAAACAAPHLRSLLDRAHTPTVPGAAEPVDLVGVSEGMCALRKAVRRAAGAPFPVLIEGESGSGKELVARAIHRESARRARRFCAVNCAALADDLLEAELFGHTRGAFTGAVAERPGLFEEADGGTLFLDEVADLSARAQAKLLRAVQDGEVRRIGENLARSVDARVVAATNRSLEAEVTTGAFRRDLFYRLHVVHVVVPPLRDRPEDIPLLAAHFWQQAIARTGSRATLAPATLAALARYDWPGNVRELQNVMAALAVSSPHRSSVGPASLPAVIARREAVGPTLETARTAFERGFVRAALARAGGHRARTAAALGMSRQGLAKVMARLGIEADPIVPG